MIKVMQVVSDMNIGGAGKVIINLINAVPKSDARIVAVVPEGSMLTSAIKGAKLIEARGMADKTFSIAGVISLVKIIRAEKPDIVHAHAGLSARIAARLAGTKIVFTRHWIGRSKVSFFSRIINNALCDMAFAVSKAASESLEATGIKKDKIVLLYNGVEALRRDDKKKLLKKLGISGKLVVGTAARLEPVKNLNCLLEAAAEIINKRDNIMFLIAGEGSQKTELITRAMELGISENVIFMGFVSDMAGFMSALDIHILCSLEEAFPTTVLEAMSAGVPNVASACGGTEEQIESGVNGLLVSVNNPHALAEGILKLAEDDKLRVEMGKTGLETYRAKFNAEQFADETLKVYKRMLS